MISQQGEVDIKSPCCDKITCGDIILSLGEFYYDEKILP